MAQNLQDNPTKEIYLTSGMLPNSKYLLIVKRDGSVTFSWYNGDIKVDYDNPKLVRCLNGMKLEYGSPTSSGTRNSIELYDYDDGKLLDRWELIKVFS